jgi:hypothetical protein
MLAFLKRQAQVDDTRFLHDFSDAKAAIEGLKGWLARGGVEWTIRPSSPDQEKLSGFKIAAAQFIICGPHAMPTMRKFLFQGAVSEISGKKLGMMLSERDWIPVMNAFGVKLRAMRKAAA